MHKTIVKNLCGLKTSKQNRTDGLIQRPRMDLRDLLGRGSNISSSNSKRKPKLLIYRNEQFPPEKGLLLEIGLLGISRGLSS